LNQSVVVDFEGSNPVPEKVIIPSASSSGNALHHSGRILSVSDCKKRSIEMLRFLEKLQSASYMGATRKYEISRLSHALRECSNYLVFHNFYTTDQIRLAKKRSCKKSLLCPFCARSRAAKNVGSDLSERFCHLRNSWQKLQKKRRDFRKKGFGFNELCKVEGSVFSYETKMNDETGYWNPHIHAVVLLNDYIDREKFSDEWEKITGDSRIMDIRKLYSSDETSMSDAFCEVFKYALKFSDLSLPDNFEAYQILKGIRLQGSFGAFWGVKLDDEDVPNNNELDGLPYLEMFYQYRGDKGFDLESVKEFNERSEREFQLPI